MKTHWKFKRKGKWLSKEKDLMAEVKTIENYILNNKENNFNGKPLEKSGEEYYGLISSIKNTGVNEIETTGLFSSYRQAEKHLKKKMAKYTPKVVWK